jgi:hypothetical protein
VEFLGYVVAGSAHDLGLEMLQGFANPFTTGSAHSFIARRTPSVWSLVIGVICRPEESGSLPIEQTISDVLAHKGLWL